MSLQPYLFYAGRCEEAIAFYEKALGAQVTYITRFSEAPEKMPGYEEWGDKIMHANITIGNAQIMMSDEMGPETGEVFKGFALSFTVASGADGEKRMDALADGGKVMMPFQKTFWSEGFGMVTDRFGVLWMITIEDKN